jgi:hypothetical protein
LFLVAFFHVDIKKSYSEIPALTPTNSSFCIADKKHGVLTVHLAQPSLAYNTSECLYDSQYPEFLSLKHTASSRQLFGFLCI